MRILGSDGIERVDYRCNPRYLRSTCLLLIQKKETALFDSLFD